MPKISFFSLAPKLDRYFKSSLEQFGFSFYFIKEYFPNETIDSRRKETSRARIVRLSLKIFKTHDTKKKKKKTFRNEHRLSSDVQTWKSHEPPSSPETKRRCTRLLDYYSALWKEVTKVVQFRAILAGVPGVNYVETLPHNTTRRSLHAVYAPWGQIMSGIGYIRKPLCLVTERGIERPV